MVRMIPIALRRVGLGGIGLLVLAVVLAGGGLEPSGGDLSGFGPTAAFAQEAATEATAEAA